MNEKQSQDRSNKSPQQLIQQEQIQRPRKHRHRRKSNLIDLSFEYESRPTTTPLNTTILDAFDPLYSKRRITASPATNSTSSKLNDLNNFQTRRNSSSELNSHESSCNSRHTVSNKLGGDNDSNKPRNNTELINYEHLYAEIEDDSINHGGSNVVDNYDDELSVRDNKYLLSEPNTTKSSSTSVYYSSNDSSGVINDISYTNRQLDRLSFLSIKAAKSATRSDTPAQKQDAAKSFVNIHHKQAEKKYADNQILSTQSNNKLNNAQNIVSHNSASSKPILRLSRKVQRSNQQYISFTKFLKNFREEYKHGDETTNTGFIYSPTISSTIASDLSVKLILTSTLKKEPLIFTCNISTTIEHIVCHAVLSLFEELEENDSMDNYMLKIVGRDEYLDSTKCLCNYSYVNYCCKFNYDLNFLLVRKSNVKRLFLRMAHDDFRCKSLLSADDLLPRQALLSYSDLSFESLNIMFETFQKESKKLCEDLIRNNGNRDENYRMLKQQDRISNYYTETRKLQPNGLVQTTKAICSMMMNCETVELTEATQNINELCVSFNNNELSLLNESDRSKVIETIENATKKITKCIHRLVELTSNCLLVDYELDYDEQINTDSSSYDSGDKHHNVKVDCLVEPSTTSGDFSQNQFHQLEPSSSKQDNTISSIDYPHQVSFIVRSACQLKPEWLTKYQNFFIECEIRYGNASLCSKIQSDTVAPDNSGFFPRLDFSFECQFDVFYASLPREARIVVTLIGIVTSAVIQSTTTSSGQQIYQQLTSTNQLQVNDYSFLRRAISSTSISDPPMYSSSPRNSISIASSTGIYGTSNSNKISTTNEAIDVKLAASIVYVFDHDLELVQGDKILYLHSLDVDCVDDMFLEIIPCRNDPYLLIEFANLKHQKTEKVIFPLSLIESYVLVLRDYKNLDAGTRYVIDLSVNDKKPFSPLLEDEKDCIWINRLYLTSLPAVLPKLLQSVPCWSAHNLDHVYKLIDAWAPLDFSDAIQLLLPMYADKYVRSYAVRRLSQLSIDELFDLVPQLLQALRYEKSLDCDLFRLLMKRSLQSVRFASLIYWQSKTNSSDKIFSQQSETIVNCLLWISGGSFWKNIDKQEALLTKLATIQEGVRQVRDSQRMIWLHKKLEVVRDFLTENRPTMPYLAGLEVVDLDLNSCSYFTSNALPLKLAFKSFEESCYGTMKINIHEAIFKAGDDLRQDMLAVQMIRIMEKLWLKEGLNLRMVTFDCLATSERQGLVEIVQNAETLRKIQQSRNKIKGAFEKRPIVEWLEKKNTSELEYQQARDNFTHSCAGYAVATYLLGICDRHNDNIMVTSSGHLFHIDFGKFLGDVQMMGSIKRDRTPFVLTPEMAYVINNGNKPSKKFQTFIELCLTAFNILRENRNLILNLFALLTASKIHGINSESVKYIDKMLMPGLSKAEAMSKFARLIDECLACKTTSLNFFIHSLAQLRFYGGESSKQSLLSFIPKTFSLQSDGRIEKLSIVHVYKQYDANNEKQYYYVVQVKRQNQLDPTNIIRTFEEFSELNLKLNSLHVDSLNSCCSGAADSGITTTSATTTAAASNSNLVSAAATSTAAKQGTCKNKAYNSGSVNENLTATTNSGCSSSSSNRRSTVLSMKTTTPSYLFLIDFVKPYKKKTREIAFQRLKELNVFLEELLQLPPEISESDLVYTFFHPILRDQIDTTANSSSFDSSHGMLTTTSATSTDPTSGDQNSTDATNAACTVVTGSSTASQQYLQMQQQRRSLYSGSSGQVKISLLFKNNSLTIVVMHAKNLASTQDGKPPNAYVKTYLLPDEQKVTKRKSRVVKQSCHPSFMELIVYDELLASTVKELTLRVSVWHYEGVVGQSKNFMGAALIPLKKLILSKENVSWYPLREY